MGSVAVACATMGYKVTGSDHAVYEPMLSVLERGGIAWQEYSDGSSLVAAAPDLVVIGNAISRGNAELEAVLDARLPITSVSAFVGTYLIDRNTSIVCAGTHGKTTTSSIAAWILHHAGMKPGFLIGGVPNGFESGCTPVDASVHNTRSGVFVAEGDEYDTAFFDKRSKFVHYRPTVAILNNIEFDHADIFVNLDAVKQAFSQLVRIVPRNGMILANADDANVHAVTTNAPAPLVTVGLHPLATWQIEVSAATSRGTQWRLRSAERSVGPFEIAMPGIHNVRNASMGILACMFAGTTEQAAALAVAAFVAPKRRLEELGTWNGAVVIDDFAHHPTAIQATIQAVRQRYPGNIHAVFEPRSNTTAQSIFQNELAACFEGATSVAFGPVNRPERFEPSQRLDTAELVTRLESAGITAMNVAYRGTEQPDWGAEVLPWLATNVRAGDVVLLLSNGNVGGLRTALVPTP